MPTIPSPPRSSPAHEEEDAFLALPPPRSPSPSSPPLSPSPDDGGCTSCRRRCGRHVSDAALVRLPSSLFSLALPLLSLSALLFAVGRVVETARHGKRRYVLAGSILRLLALLVAVYVPGRALAWAISAASDSLAPLAKPLRALDFYAVSSFRSAIPHIVLTVVAVLVWDSVVVGVDADSQQGETVENALLACVGVAVAVGLRGLLIKILVTEGLKASFVARAEQALQFKHMARMLTAPVSAQDGDGSFRAAPAAPASPSPGHASARAVPPRPQELRGSSSPPPRPPPLPPPGRPSTSMTAATSSRTSPTSRGGNSTCTTRRARWWRCGTRRTRRSSPRTRSKCV
jgi:hypothetical protein